MSLSETENKPDLILAKKLNVVAWIVSAIVLLLVGLMRQYKIETDLDFSALPGLHAILNSITSILLILAYINIRAGRVEWHRKLMLAAVACSLLFLMSYVTYHFTTESTAFCRDGWIRPVYFFILISHVVLAAIIFPFILFTLVRAWTRQFARHKKIARWVFPIWLYVAVSGPVVFLLLKPCYA